MPREYGSRYEATKGLDMTEVAKLVRKDIKEAIADGHLPGAPVKYSVRKRRSTYKWSIEVTIKNWPEPDRRWSDHAHNMNVGGWVMTNEAKAASTVLHSILDRYNFDGSDPLTDYTDVRFFGLVDFDHATTPRNDMDSYGMPLNREAAV